MIKRSFFHRCFFFRPRISDHNYLSLHKCKICNTETHQKAKIQSQLLTEATLNMRIIHDPTSCCVWATYCVIFSQTFVPLRKHSIYLHCREHCVKSVRIRSYSGPYFPAFRLNTERYSVSLCIHSKCEKIRTGITPNSDTFNAVVEYALINIKYKKTKSYTKKKDLLKLNIK